MKSKTAPRDSYYRNVCGNDALSYATTVRDVLIIDLKLDRSSRTTVSGVKLCSHQSRTLLNALPLLLRRGTRMAPSICCWLFELRGAGLWNNFCIPTSTLITFISLLEHCSSPHVGSSRFAKKTLAFCFLFSHITYYYCSSIALLRGRRLFL